MFGGNNGMTTYDGATGKFAETNSTNWAPFNYSTEAAFMQKADLSIAGVLQDCGECHVGGGAMEYVPWTATNMANRTSLRNIATTNVNGGTAITSAAYTTFNYLIDTYDVDGDNDKGEVLYNDYAKTGVGEMDCMMCHLEGYSWDDRTEQIRLLKHDTARVVGAGMATPNALAKGDWAANVAPVGWGTTVGAYDTNKVVDNGSGLLKLSTSFADNIKKLPPTANCASCHFGNGFGVGDTLGADGNPARRMVDFKKRGDHWATNAIWDVHSPSLDCMDCHENKGSAIYVAGAQPDGAAGVDATTGTSGAAYGTGADTVNNTTGAAGADGFVDASGVPVEMTGAGAGLQGLCDPKKGFGNFESVWNAKDAGSNLTCTLCHKPGGNSQYPLAKDPAAAHAAAGLSDLKVQSKTSTGGVANASHLDIIECNTCHIRKLDNYSGAAIVDATGKDHAGRLADHENEYLEKNMNDKLIHVWYNGKLSKASNSLTMFWTDKNDQRDANNDGRAFGLDPLLMTHVEQINSVNGWASISEDKHGVIAAADITARQTAFATAMDAKLGLTGDPIIPKLCIMGVPFNVDHGTSRKSESWGAKGCKDCHSPTSNFFSGAFAVKPDHMTMTWSSGQVVPYTKVNSGKDMTSYHPAMVNKKEQRTLPINLAATGITSLTTVERGKFMYEETFKKPNTAWSGDAGVITGANFTLPSATYNPTSGVAGTTKGLFMLVQVKDVGADDSTAKRITMQCGGEVATINALLAAMDGSGRAAGRLASGEYGFTATVGSGGDTATGNLVLTANAGKEIRVVPAIQQSDDGAILGFDNALYVADPITGVFGGTYTGRVDWVNYLNSIGAADAADITAPVGAPANVVKGVATAFTANTIGHNPGDQYKWDMGNGTVCKTNPDTVVGGYVCTAPDDGNPATPESWTVPAPATAASISYAYPTTGLYTARLYVTAPAGGDTTNDSVQVQVGNAAPTWTASLNTATTPDQLELAALPSTWTKIYVIWDDGTKQNYTTNPGAAAVNIPHTYRKIAAKYVNGHYVYNTTIRIYNGTTLLGTKVVPVTL